MTYKHVRIETRDGITHIYDDEGRDLTKTLAIKSITFDHNAGDKPTITLEIYGDNSEVEYLTL